LAAKVGKERLGGVKNKREEGKGTEGVGASKDEVTLASSMEQEKDRGYRKDDVKVTLKGVAFSFKNGEEENINWSTGNTRK